MDLLSHRFISYFEEEQAEQLCQLSTVYKYPEQTLIFEEGSKADCLYLVLEGTVEFSKRVTSNKFQTFARALPDNFFGEFGVIDGQPRSARAVALPGTVIAKVPRDKLMEILHNSKGSVVLSLFGYIIQYLRTTTDQYVSQIVRKEKMTSVGEMVNTIIHDFKSPFTGIQLSSQMIKELHPDEETQEWCDLISIQVLRMVSMAEEVLEFTRGSSVINKKTISLSSIISKFEKLNRVYFHSNHVEFIVEIPDEIYMEADENKLLRVWQNLIGNAIEAFEGKSGKITTTARVEGEWIEIYLSDNGPGIPKEIRDNLFEPFVTFRKRGGTGLGTAIAKSIIDSHGGTISFVSEPGNGTTFNITLPLAKKE